MNLVEETVLPGSVQKESKADPSAEAFRREMRKISRQSAVFFAGTIFTLIGGYFFKIYTARMLGAKGLGLYALGMSVVAFFRLFAHMGIPRSMVRFVPAYLANGQFERLRALLWRGALIVCSISLLLGGLMWLMRDPIASWVFHEPELKSVLALLAIMVPLGSMGFLLQQTIVGYQQTARAKSISSFFTFPLMVILTVVFLSIGWGLRGYILASLLSSGAGLIFLALVAWRLTPTASREPDIASFRMEREVVTFAAYMVGMGMVGFLSGKADRILLGIYLDARQVGIYNVAMTMGAFIPMVLQSVNSIFAPIISELYARGDYKLLQRLFQSLTKWVLGFTWPLVIVIIMFAPALMRIFGAEFEAGWPVLVAVVVGQLVNVGVGSVGYLLLMSGNQQRVVRIQVITGIATLLLNLLFIPLWGVLGAGITMASGLVASNVMYLWEVRQRLGLFPYHRGYTHLLWPMATAALMAFFVRWFGATQELWDWVAVLIALVLSYLALLFGTLMSGLDDDERLIARAVWAQIRLIRG